MTTPSPKRAAGFLPRWVALDAPPHKLADARADPSRIRYNAGVPLQSLPSGPYMQEVLAADRAARATSTRQIAFTVE